MGALVAAHRATRQDFEVEDHVYQLERMVYFARWDASVEAGAWS